MVDDVVEEAAPNADGFVEGAEPPKLKADGVVGAAGVVVEEPPKAKGVVLLAGFVVDAEPNMFVDGSLWVVLPKAGF